MGASSVCSRPAYQGNGLQVGAIEVAAPDVVARHLTGKRSVRLVGDLGHLLGGAEQRQGEAVPVGVEQLNAIARLRATRPSLMNTMSLNHNHLADELVQLAEIVNDQGEIPVGRWKQQGQLVLLHTEDFPRGEFCAHALNSFISELCDYILSAQLKVNMEM